MKRKSVCFGCKDERHAGCGAHCKKFQDERKDRQKEYAERLKNRNVISAQIEFAMERKRK